jgi:transcriptional regulator with GAF, ATPase, and Fis domain
LAEFVAGERTLTSIEESAGGPGTGGQLLVVGGGQVFTFALPVSGEVVIGRAPECQVIIDHRKLSRRHAVLRVGPPPTVQDLGSTNGTRVARELLHGGEPVALPPGESFQIGPFSLLVVPPRRVGDSGAATGAEVFTVSDPTVPGAQALVQNIAAADISVLVLGETGVGKELLAETLHALSGRRGPLLRINCAALSEGLLESELFGHEKGAFTGAIAAKPGLLESAAGGTVFLDEVGEMPIGMQAKLLRALEAREVMRVGGLKSIPLDVRFIAATNRDLKARVAEREFRADLYYRLDGVTLLIPPLRERRGQIAPLAMKFLADSQTRQGKVASVRISAGALSQLQTYNWPGNVRELKAVVERAAVLARGDEIRTEHMQLGARAAPSDPYKTSMATPEAMAAALASPLSQSQETPGPTAGGSGSMPALDHTLSAAEQAERAKIVEALDACAGNQTRAAKLLGVSRATLVTKIAIYRIPRPRKK